MYDDEDDDGAIFLLVLGVLAGVLAIIMWWFQSSGDSLALNTSAPAPTAEVVAEPEPEPEPEPTAAAVVAPAAAAAAYTIDLGTDAGVGGAATTAVLTGEVASLEARQAAGDQAAAVFDSVNNQLTIVDDGSISADLPANVTVIGSSLAGVAAGVDSAYGTGSYALTNNLGIVEEAPAEAAEYTVDLGTNAGLGGAPTSVVLTGEVANETARQAAELQASALFDTVDNQLTIVDDGSISADLPANVTVIGSSVAGLSGTVDSAYGTGDYALANNLTIVEEPSSEDLVASLNELFQLEPIQFDTGSAAIRAESEATLNEAIRLLTSVPTGDVEIQGHTDDRGSQASNQSLSQARAESVRDYLVNGGVDDARLSANGYGEDSPVADNGTSEGRQLNRRIEFQLAG